MAEESEDIEASVTNSTASAGPQLLIVSPKDLYFPPPHTREISATLVLQNPTNETVTYKIKTTAPKRYVVRPPFGVCLPNQSTEVTVTLTYHKDPPTAPEKGDKFQVQAVTLKAGQEMSSDSLKEIWKNRPAVVKTKIAAHFTESPQPVKPQAHAEDAHEKPSTTAASHGATNNDVAPVATQTPATANDVTSASHAPKARGGLNVESSTQTNKNHAAGVYIDPVSTPPPKASGGNVLIPLALVFLLGLILGFVLGLYYGYSPTETIVVAAKAASEPVATAAKAAAKTATKH